MVWPSELMKSQPHRLSPDDGETINYGTLLERIREVREWLKIELLRASHDREFPSGANKRQAEIHRIAEDGTRIHQALKTFQQG